MSQFLDTLPVFNRELSWLSFNERVLQEAEDAEVPLIERIRFLGIYSNNLDEFYRVRVATVLRLSNLKKKSKKTLSYDPQELLDKIHNKVKSLQKRHIKAFKNCIKELEKENIFLLNETQLDPTQKDFVKDYFNDKVRSLLVPIMLQKEGGFPALKDEEVYFSIILKHNQTNKEDRFALIEIPSILPRFIELPSDDKNKYLIFIDDIIRQQLNNVFTFFDIHSTEAYAFKITRDAEMDIEEDISTTLLEKMEQGVANRKKGNYVRFVYDREMPENLELYLQEKLNFTQKDIFDEGGRYHNKKDLLQFPSLGKKELNFKPRKPIKVAQFHKQISLLKVIEKEDILLQYPYQDFGYNIDILREAAIDPDVTKIKINLYRVASNSKIINALVNAIKNGKEVTVSVELKARFDEENNIHWSNYLEAQGAKVLFGVPGLKVHSKLILIQKRINGEKLNIAHIGTGNFHEKTANIYTDLSLWTANPEIANEVEDIFAFFKHNYIQQHYKFLVVSPYDTRRKFTLLIEREIKFAKQGKKAFITLKFNNLVDKGVIKKLYEASQAGVQITCIIRGICALVPQLKGVSENIKVISIVGRYLEHTRIIKFHNDGNPLYFISSADWMTRNIENRIEVSTPILDQNLQKQIDKNFEILLKDNVKARIIDKKQDNQYVTRAYHDKPFKAQLETRKYYQKLYETKELY